MTLLPKEIFVTHEHQEDDGGWYSTTLTPEDAVSSADQDAPLVGTYRLVEENILELVRTTKIKKHKEGEVMASGSSEAAMGAWVCALAIGGGTGLILGHFYGREIGLGSFLIGTVVAIFGIAFLIGLAEEK